MNNVDWDKWNEMHDKEMPSRKRLIATVCALVLFGALVWAALALEIMGGIKP